MSNFRNDRDANVTIAGDLDDRAAEAAKFQKVLAPSKPRASTGLKRVRREPLVKRILLTKLW